jgi:hypothetical protein
MKFPSPSATLEPPPGFGGAKMPECPEEPVMKSFPGSGITFQDKQNLVKNHGAYIQYLLDRVDQLEQKLVEFESKATN